MSLGYLRMVLADRFGPLNENQRKYLEEVEKACARLSTISAELSDLAKRERGESRPNPGRVDLRALLASVISALPPDSERNLAVELSTGEPIFVRGDATQLKLAFKSLFLALRRELLTGNRLMVRCSSRQENGAPVSWIAIADEENVDRLEHGEPSLLPPFNECRGGTGLSVPIASWILAAHGAGMWSLETLDEKALDKDVKAAAVVMFPLAE